MSDQTSSKSLALFVTNNELIYSTRSIVEEESFFSEAVKISLPDLNKQRDYQDIEDIIKSNLPLLLYYNKITICYLSTPVAIIPKAYTTDNLSQFLQFSETKKLTAIKYPLDTIDANVVFNAYSPLDKVFKNLPNFNNSKTIHTANLLIDRFELNSEKNQIFVQLINQKLELCIYKQKEFTLYNIFEITADEDIIYYILNLIEQLKLNPSKTILSIEGGIEEDHLVIEQLSKYINEVETNTTANGLNYLFYKIFECE